MAEIIDFSVAKAEIIEDRVKAALNHILAPMPITDGEMALAINTAVWRVRNGWHPIDAKNEAIRCAEVRQQERADLWYRLGEHGFVPAWDGGPDAA